jgi:hypothetical protein
LTSWPRSFSVLNSLEQQERRPMPPNLENLTPASPEALANSLAFALQFSGRKRRSQR